MTQHHEISSQQAQPLHWEFRPDGGRWRPIEVPAPWQRFHPNFHGAGTYCTVLHRDDDQPYLLRFEAVATDASVLVNGSQAGSHVGPWTPFEVDLTSFLHADPVRPNTLEVRVDEKPGHPTAGFLPEIGAAFGGIWGPVTRGRPSASRQPAPSPRRPSVRVEGARIFCGDAPLHLRGILHWGYYPELGAPMPSDATIRDEISTFQAMGFNTIKFCLFIPPERYLTLCDALGMWVWQEYPIWNQPLEDPALLVEFEEFLRRDSLHPSVIVRSLTCENDRVDPDLARRLCEMIEDHAPGSLVVDNSAWLSAERIGDFYDEHPYLHNAEWRYYGRRMARALEALPPKPLLLGETMAVDTWNDLQGVEPLYAASQRALEEQVDCRGVLERSLRRARAVRKHQVETLLRELPATGYMMNAARDIGAAPLGFWTADGRPKFAPRDWSWQGDTVLLCDLEDRGYAAGSELDVGLWVAHHGRQPLRGDLRLVFADRSETFPIALTPGTTTQVATVRLALPQATTPRSNELRLILGELENRWSIWSIPVHDELGPRSVAARIVEALEPRALSELEAGATLIHLAGPRRLSWRAPAFTWWSPVIWGESGVPVEGFVEDLILHDLLSGRVLAPSSHTRSLLEVWDTHMVPDRVVRHPLVAATRLGRGKLVISALRHDRPAGRYLLRRLLDVVADGAIELPAFEAHLSSDSVFAQRWEMRRKSSHDRTDAVKVVCDTPLVNAGRNVFEGWARFRARLVIPETWHEKEAILCCEAVGDAFIVTIGGREIGRSGNITGTWDGTRDRAQAFPVRLAPGEHEIAFDVRDWRGGGGLVGPVYLTRTPGSVIY